VSDSPLYTEETSFSPLLTVVTLLFAGIGMVGGLLTPSADPSTRPILVGGTVFFVLFALNTYQLRVYVYRDRIHARVGRILPFFWANVRAAEIESVQIVELGWLRWSAGGHFGRFRGRPAMTILAGGRRAVCIERRKWPLVLIGSEEPERLAKAIERVRSETSR